MALLAVSVMTALLLIVRSSPVTPAWSPAMKVMLPPIVWLELMVSGLIALI